MANYVYSSQHPQSPRHYNFSSPPRGQYASPISRMSMDGTASGPVETDPMLPPPPMAITHTSHASHALFNSIYPSPASPTSFVPAGSQAQVGSEEAPLPPSKSREESPKGMSKKLYQALLSKPKLSRTWEKKSFAEELEGMQHTPPSSGDSDGFPQYLSPRGRPASLYTSPAEFAAFRPLPMVETQPMSQLQVGAMGRVSVGPERV
ncbi:uncharacterized protein L203_106220 [Cryptococcus depauperatus CBS 7841]|uniref:Uncharacterized protein n=1 Tax=Cryptococcus depauperatus CBS 7841 TaxID=1295531 RepID=A0A1E3IY77_9TREE|nr:hypothetical protein L203_00930 [Cryptococcus depauperatus CBS 7841]